MVYSSKWDSRSNGLRFLCTPEDKIMETIVHCGMVGTTIRKVFTDVDYAGNVPLLAGMAQVLFLSLGIGKRPKAKPCRNIHLAKCCQHLQALSFEVVGAFTYLGSPAVPSGSSEQEMKH